MSDSGETRVVTTAEDLEERRVTALESIADAATRFVQLLERIEAFALAKFREDEERRQKPVYERKPYGR